MKGLVTCKDRKKGEEPWADDEEVSVMLKEVAKARKRAKLNTMGEPLAPRRRGARRNTSTRGEGLSTVTAQKKNFTSFTEAV